LPTTRSDIENRVTAGVSGFFPLARELHARTDRDLSSAARLLSRVAAMQQPWQDMVRQDISNQLNTLFHSEYLLHEREPFLNRYACYLKAIDVRIERLGHAAAKDAERVAQIAPCQARMETLKEGLYDAEALEEYRCMLQEWRVSLFAQSLGTPQPISLKRIDKQWAIVTGT
ncbi:MAG: DUF3418 domain-containing protein, partial [Verrucomicrobia bacterium]|nr:DUF3418 domain-containing protein [Verrucomicrobiota bacterium]